MRGSRRRTYFPRLPVNSFLIFSIRESATDPLYGKNPCVRPARALFRPGHVGGGSHLVDRPCLEVAVGERLHPSTVATPGGLRGGVVRGDLHEMRSRVVGAEDVVRPVAHHLGQECEHDEHANRRDGKHERGLSLST